MRGKLKMKRNLQFYEWSERSWSGRRWRRKRRKKSGKNHCKKLKAWKMFLPLEWHHKTVRSPFIWNSLWNCCNSSRRLWSITAAGKRKEIKKIFFQFSLIIFRLFILLPAQCLWLFPIIADCATRNHFVWFWAIQVSKTLCFGWLDIIQKLLYIIFLCPFLLKIKQIFFSISLLHLRLSDILDILRF